MTKPISDFDLASILKRTLPFWESLRNQRIFITGGTGFFGMWLLESFVYANQALSLNAKAGVLTRDASAFAKKRPDLADLSCLSFYEGDVRDFNYPGGEFAYVIHAATDSSAALAQTSPTLMLDTLVQGTKHTLNFAVEAKAKQFLYVSSGAVYGSQPASVTHISEASPLEYQDPLNPYAYGKRFAEYLCGLYAKQFNLEIKIARCFAFVGPYLPLDSHFAIGNFIRDGLQKKNIAIKGDGTPYRSYLYAADLAVWLWTILFSGQSLRPYNVGSDEVISIRALAALVGEIFEVPLEIQSQPTPSFSTHYVPDVTRAKTELNLNKGLSLRQALQSTKAWYVS